MIKNIKRVGIIFLVIAIICLMAIGCLVTTNVSNKADNLSVLNKNNQNGISTTTDYSSVIPEANETIHLGTTSSEMTTNWGIAYNKLKTGKKIKVVLDANWTLSNTNNATGFENGSIKLPSSCKVIIEFSGHDIKAGTINQFFKFEGTGIQLYLTSNSISGGFIERYVWDSNTGSDQPQYTMIANSSYNTDIIFNNIDLSGFKGMIANTYGNVFLYNTRIAANEVDLSYRSDFVYVLSCSAVYIYDSLITNCSIISSSYRSDIELIKADNIYIAGKVEIKNNKKILEGNASNIAIKKAMTLKGELTQGTQIQIEELYFDTIAKDYTKYNGMTSPSNYFSIKYPYKDEYNTGYLPMISGTDVVVVDREEYQEVGLVLTSATNSKTYFDSYIKAIWGKDMAVQVKNAINDENFRITQDNITYTDSIILENIGTYKIYVENSDVSFTLEITPLYVPLEAFQWSNSQFTYNGAEQKPTAVIGGNYYNDCKVNVTGGATDVGIYRASVLSLSNKNMKLAGGATHEFKILPASLSVDVTTNNVEYGYSGYNAKPSDWYTLSTTGLLGNDSNQSLSRLFTINDNAFIPQFNGNDNAIDIGEYSISTKNIDNVNLAMYGNNNYNITFNYINSGKLSIVKPSVVRTSTASKYNYLVYENNRRVTYAEKGWIHGVDDNTRSANDLVLGNIMPNTSVQSFLNNLVFNDMAALTLKNSKGETIYTNGEIDSKYSALINNGMELAIGTGWTLEYERESITLSVLGDLTGDGKVNSADVNVARQIVNNKSFESLDNNMKYSMLIINKGNIPNGTDTEILWNVVCGKMDIESFI